MLRPAESDNEKKADTYRCYTKRDASRSRTPNGTEDRPTAKLQSASPAWPLSRLRRRGAAARASRRVLVTMYNTYKSLSPSMPCVCLCVPAGNLGI